MSTLEKQYEALSDEALLEILAEGRAHYRAEALEAAVNEATARGLDPTVADYSQAPPSVPSGLARFLGFYLLFFGYGAIVSIPMTISQLVANETPTVILVPFPIAMALVGVLLLHLGSRIVVSWRLCIFWSAVVAPVAWLLGTLLGGDPRPAQPSTLSVVVSLTFNMIVIVALRRHAWKRGSGAA